MLTPDRIAQALLPLDQPATGGHIKDDFDFAEVDAETRPASVLLPLFEYQGQLHLWFTRRSEALRQHAGQISFPGGGREPQDSDWVATALRETHEEIGIHPQSVQTLGLLDDYRTGTGYTITPVVGIVSSELELIPDENEVAEIFHAPLDFVIDRSNHQRRTSRYKGRDRTYFVIEYGQHHIWGATAGMLVNFSLRLENYVSDHRR